MAAAEPVAVLAAEVLAEEEALVAAGAAQDKCIKCAKCCRHYNGLITVSKAEFLKYKKSGRTDITRHLMWTGRHYLAWYKEDGTKLPECPYLKNNECQIHDIKPKMCSQFFCEENPGFFWLDI